MENINAYNFFLFLLIGQDIVFLMIIYTLAAYFVSFNITCTFLFLQYLFYSVVFNNNFRKEGL